MEDLGLILVHTLYLSTCGAHVQAVPLSRMDLQLPQIRVTALQLPLMYFLIAPWFLRCLFYNCQHAEPPPRISPCLGWHAKRPCFLAIRLHFKPYLKHGNPPSFKLKQAICAHLPAHRDICIKEVWFMSNPHKDRRRRWHICTWTALNRTHLPSTSPTS